MGGKIPHRGRLAQRFLPLQGQQRQYRQFRQENATITNPKLGLIFGPWAKTEYYINLGGGFRSNDARGTTITVDPKSGLAADRVTPLVRHQGRRHRSAHRHHPRLAKHVHGISTGERLELLFLGDAGTTEASRPSRRTGFEFANYYQPTDWLVIDADVAYAKARFRDHAPEGNRIPGAVEGVASLAALVDNVGPWFGSLHLRYFGPRALVEDNSVRSNGTTLLNGQVGYKLRKDVRVALQIFNLLNRKADAITYYYESQLANEAAPVSDKHFHPVESRSLRLTLTSNF